MNRAQAIAAMKQGSKVRHLFFFPGEFVTGDAAGNVYDETGLLLNDYWKYRNSDTYDKDWEAYPVFADKCWPPGTIPVPGKEIFEYKNWQEFIAFAEIRSREFEGQPLLYLSKSGICCTYPSDFISAKERNDYPIKAYLLQTFKTINIESNVQSTKNKAVQF